ncbi:hypothetical protein DWZ46_02590 [Faecalibacterium prausnitzii]|uniref:Lipoprotein n=1 Tax=Faecalibacterium prausnitzii TaxID=853 RepID=A0A3E2UAK5_9FIRM|nr:hypothetical protein [Faecalibacterium prausnitzii]RGB93249.1 hypothetical protein DWZ46_02590 [Faecalibacterium prausnitzii]
MTKLRKLTALLLAGVLTLLLLTACSGGGGSSGPEAQAEAEAKVMQAINNDRAMNGRAVALANDDGMRTVANTRLDALELVLKGNARGYQFFNKVDAKWDNDNKNATLTLVAKYDYNDTTLQKIIDQIKGSDQNEALDFALNGNYTKAGVAARIIHGQTYVAISLRVGRNL